jgi:hypothetical protein
VLRIYGNRLEYQHGLTTDVIVLRNITSVDKPAWGNRLDTTTNEGKKHRIELALLPATTEKIRQQI